ncbi:solute carrier family 35 member F5-like [Xenia sp. Carnegie-2017]|uniref:solute carrier family 35 member F5-like n=1 Tax=Xenia sp. Carnegie-2017 TaxID=2897299 RepID=UPI001F0491CA|nr:solute carrier family 35 member F5-like [Xenia sp. Carnegie-2017]
MEVLSEEDSKLLGEETKADYEKSKRYRRLIIGGICLVFVDILWAASAELSDFIFHNEGFDKPYFTTYFKTAAFVLYLPCVMIRSQYVKHRRKHRTVEESTIQTPILTASIDLMHKSNENIYNECPLPEGPESSRYVKEEKLPVFRIMKIALIFCILWFLATLSYQEALDLTSPAAVNILSSSSGLFTLILSALFQSSTNDKFSFSKLLAVFISIAGIVLVVLSDSRQTKGEVNYGALFSLAGAILYACYLVLLKLKVPNEEQMDIAMFFGFVGLFNILLLWPGFSILDVTNIEVFEMPSTWEVWCSIGLNAVFGTVVSEYLWLWGCYLTSSLSATLALGMVMPLTMLMDILRGRIHLSFMFVAGSIPIFLSFFAINYLCHYENWDPVRTAVFWIYNRLRRHILQFNHY